MVVRTPEADAAHHPGFDSKVTVSTQGVDAVGYVEILLSGARFATDAS